MTVQETQAIDAIPPCPYCGEEMGKVQVTLQDLVWSTPFEDETLPRRPDGFALPHGTSLSVTCPACSRLSQLTNSQGFDVHRVFNLVPTRTIAELVEVGDWDAVDKCAWIGRNVPERPKEADRSNGEG